MQVVRDYAWGKLPCNEWVFRGSHRAVQSRLQGRGIQRAESKIRTRLPRSAIPVHAVRPWPADRRFSVAEEEEEMYRRARGSHPFLLVRYHCVRVQSPKCALFRADSKFSHEAWRELVQL